MKIAIFSPVHSRPDLIKYQIANYEKLLSTKPMFFLHPSIESEKLFEDFSYSSEFGGDVLLCKQRWNTTWTTIMGAYISCTHELVKSGISFDYIYIHTDGDLLFKSGLVDYILENKIGFSRSAGIKNSGWLHCEELLRDQRFKAFLDSNKIAEESIFYGRQEGSFFPVSIWMRIVNAIEVFFNESIFKNSCPNWPVEEVLIPTLASFFISNDINPVGNVIFTKPIIFSGGRDNDENCLRLEDIEYLLSNENNSWFGAKWFSHNINDSARVYIDNKISIDRRS